MIGDDYSAAAVVAPIHMFVLMVHEDSGGKGPLALSTLRSDWSDQHTAGWPKQVSHARGPFGVYVASLFRVGWRPTISPLLIDTGTKQPINILEVGPMLLRRLAL